MFDIGNASGTPLTISSATVGSNDNCFFLLTSPTSPIAPHSSSTGRVRLYATSSVECEGLVSLTTSDSTYPYFSFFVKGYVGPAPWVDPYVGFLCPSN